MMSLVKCKECGNEISKKASKCPSCGAPQKKKWIGGKTIFWLIAVFIIIGFIARENDQPTTSVNTADKTQTSSQNQTTTSSNEIVMTDEMRRDVTAAIQKAGFNCPEAKQSYAKGVDAHGTVTKIYCGPKGQPGIYQKAVFRFTFLPNDQIKVQPWK